MNISISTVILVLYKYKHNQINDLLKYNQE